MLACVRVACILRYRAVRRRYAVLPFGNRFRLLSVSAAAPLFAASVHVVWIETAVVFSPSVRNSFERNAVVRVYTAVKFV